MDMNGNMKRLFYLLVICVFASIVNAQSNAVINYHNMASRTFKEYGILSHNIYYWMQSNTIIMKGQKISYKYPNIILCWEEAYAPNVISSTPSWPGKYSLTIPIYNTTIEITGKNKDLIKFSNPNGFTFDKRGVKEIINSYEFKGKSDLTADKFYYEMEALIRLLKSENYTGVLPKPKPKSQPSKTATSPTQKTQAQEPILPSNPKPKKPDRSM